MDLITIIAIASAVYIVSDLYRRIIIQSRRFRVVLFLLKATERALTEKGGMSREALYDAQQKTLYNMQGGEIERTRSDLAKEGIVIER